MRATDYEGSVHRDYVRGRRLDDATHAVWNEAFGRHLPTRRPLLGLDLGSGTGRFAPWLATAFGPVLGVEPSDAMRGIAVADAAHPEVRYVAGSAEHIPADDESFDYCLLFLVWHHVQDPARAAREIARVLRPGGVLLCRTPFSDRMPELWWLSHFPGGPDADAELYRPLEVELATFASAGLVPSAALVPSSGVVEVFQPSFQTKAERLEQLRTRTLSTLHRMPDADVRAGLAAVAEAVALDPDAPAPGVTATMLVLSKTPT